LDAHGPAEAGLAWENDRETFFSQHEPDRLRVLFGPPDDLPLRSTRRGELVRWLYADGYEPVPATMGPPYRGIRVNPYSGSTDSQGMTWYDYEITEPEPFSRVFGPLARYKLYERLDDNRAWGIDFARPRRDTWTYVCEHYAAVQAAYHFDFMRGDMSHVQMRTEGVPEHPNPAFYDLLGTVKTHIQQENHAPHFGYFAETFLAERDVMGYGDEIDHLEASHADTTLGDLQSIHISEPTFLPTFRRYLDFAATRQTIPNFTVMTADKDDPRFDKFYTSGSVLRLFIALGLGDMPSYMGLGFETRDILHGPAPNEHYTKLYVFQETVGEKATQGPYVWGKNGALFADLQRLRAYIDANWAALRGRATRWLLPPPPLPHALPLIAWTQADKPTHVFVANTNTTEPLPRVTLPALELDAPLQLDAPLRLDFSTARHVPAADHALAPHAGRYFLRELAPGEGRVYGVG
jgi:hypothetical protein